MTRNSLIGVAFLCTLLLGYGPAPAPDQEGQKLLLEGDMALWTVAIKPDKTAQFEQVLAKLRTALQTSDKPERQQQGKSWKVMRMTTPLPDGNVGYVHIVGPTVPNTDYAASMLLTAAAGGVPGGVAGDLRSLPGVVRRQPLVGERKHRHRPRRGAVAAAAPFL